MFVSVFLPCVSVYFPLLCHVVCGNFLDIQCPIGRQQAAEAGDVRAQFQLAQRWRQGTVSY